MASESPTEGSYEFSDEQNQTLISLASNMRIVAIFLVIGGGLICLLGLIGGIALLSSGQVAQGLVGGLEILVLGACWFLIPGIYTMGSSASFRQVISTKGDDIGNLMKALHAQRNMYRMLAILFLVWLGLFVFLIIIGILAGMTR